MASFELCAWHLVSATNNVLPCPMNTAGLAFKFYPTKTIDLDCSKIYLIKAISNTKKELYWEGHAANQIFEYMLLF